MVSTSTSLSCCCFKSIRTVLEQVCHFPGHSQIVGVGNLIAIGNLGQFVGGGIGVILQHNGTFCRELVLYNFPLVVFAFNIKNIFHMWCCMLGGPCLNLNESNLFWVIEVQTHFRTFLACQNEFEP